MTRSHAILALTAFFWMAVALVEFVYIVTPRGVPLCFSQDGVTHCGRFAERTP
jgi:hypothetical protein